MNLNIKTIDLLSDFVKGLGTITNHAILETNNVGYNRKEGKVTIYIKRCKIRKKKTALGLIERTMYDYSNKIRSLVTINQVEQCTIRNNFSSDMSEVELLFGMNIDNNKIYLCSVEDNHREPFYSIDIEVNEIDIDLSDC